jgi:hypothetical protein
MKIITMCFFRSCLFTISINYFYVIQRFLLLLWRSLKKYKKNTFVFNNGGGELPKIDYSLMLSKPLVNLHVRLGVKKEKMERSEMRERIIPQNIMPSS